MASRVSRTVELDGRQIDTASKEWLLICLARHVCRMPTKSLRNQFIEALKWSPNEKLQLRELTKQEWQRMFS